MARNYGRYRMASLRVTLLRISASVFVSAHLWACMGNAPVLEVDNTPRAIEISEQYARQVLGCPSARAGKTLRSESLTDAAEPLHSLYRVWIEGCGKHGVYRVICNEDEQCNLEPG